MRWGIAWSRFTAESTAPRLASLRDAYPQPIGEGTLTQRCAGGPRLSRRFREGCWLKWNRESSYGATPHSLSMNVYSVATSRSLSKRPDAPPCPAPRFTRSSSGLLSVFSVRSFATYLVGSQ